jgi:hypothetical protein
MSRFLDAIKAHASAMDEQRGQPRWGVVTSVNPTKYTVKVTLQPEGVQTGWLPVATASGGNGWGIVALPAIGQQVLCIPDTGDGQHYVVLGVSFSTSAMPPQVPNAPGASNLPVQAGEMALVHQSGSLIRLCADGTIYSRGNWLHDGDFTAKTGDVYDKHGSLDRLRRAYNSHTDVDSHGDTAGPPTPQDPE